MINKTSAYCLLEGAFSCSFFHSWILQKVQFVFQSKKQWVLTINTSLKDICFVLHIKMNTVIKLHLDHMLFKYTHRQFWLVQAGIVWTTSIGNSVRMKTRTKPQMAIKCLGAFSIRPNIPVWNSGYSMWQMEQSSGSKFCVKIWNQMEDSFTFCLLALGLRNDAEVEINDVLGEGDNIQ